MSDEPEKEGTFPKKLVSDRRKRGSFQELVHDVEAHRIESGQQSDLSSGAFRAGMLVRMLRKSGGLSQTALAQKLGVSQARISEIEAGVGPQGPTWDLMERIANACGATLLAASPNKGFALDVAQPDNLVRRWVLADPYGPNAPGGYELWDPDQNGRILSHG